MVATIDSKPEIFIPTSDIQRVLSVYFSQSYSELIKRDNEIVSKEVQAMSYDSDMIPTTGASVFDVLEWSIVKTIIDKLEQIIVNVSNVQYEGRYVYVLACWAGKEDPTNENNIINFGPEPKAKHLESALRAFLKELNKVI